MRRTLGPVRGYLAAGTPAALVYLLLLVRAWTPGHDRASLARRPDHDTETAPYRVVQEALTNVAKHARARRCRISLEADEHGWRLEVADDGVGFDPGGAAAPAGGGHFGLVAMRERSKLVGGTCTVDSRPDHGTRVTVMDLRMPNLDGIEATRAITASHPKVRVLVVSAYGDESLVVEALLAGAHGYLLKGVPMAQLAQAVTATAVEECRLAGTVTGPVLDRLVDQLQQERAWRQRLEEQVRQLELLTEELRRGSTR